MISREKNAIIDGNPYLGHDRCSFVNNDFHLTFLIAAKILDGYKYQVWNVFIKFKNPCLEVERFEIKI